MEKIIASRHFDVDETTKVSIIEELTQLEAEYNKLTSARVILDQQKNWYFSEIVLRGKNLDLEARAKAHELPIAFRESFDKLERQLRKHIDKVQDHNKVPVREIELQQAMLDEAEEASA